MSAISIELEEFFDLGAKPMEQFEFMDQRYLYAYTSPAELKELVEELIH